MGGRRRGRAGRAAAAAASEGGDEDETRDGETLTRAQSAILSLPPAGAELEGGSSLDALVGNASRLARLERALDVAAWQTVGTSLYVGERAETRRDGVRRRARGARRPRRRRRRRRRTRASGEPFLPETRGVLASETNGVTAAEPPVAGAGPSLFPRPDDAGEASDADAASRDRDREGDEAPETSIRGAPVPPAASSSSISRRASLRSPPGSPRPRPRTRRASRWRRSCARRTTTWRPRWRSARAPGGGSRRRRRRRGSYGKRV